MAEGRQAHDWSMTAALLVALLEPHRDSKERPEPFTPNDFNPFAGTAEDEPQQPTEKLPVSFLLTAYGFDKDATP